MKRFLVIAMLITFSANAGSESKKCLNAECETTWAQWLGGAFALAMVYQYASEKLPLLDYVNSIVLEKAVVVGNAMTVWVMHKFTRQHVGLSTKTQ